MEKEKPYKCDVCGKRYKNLNGLKYVSTANRTHISLVLTVCSTNNIPRPATPK
jgi:hypothetical protein